MHPRYPLTLFLVMTLMINRPVVAGEPADVPVDGVSILLTNASAEGNQVSLVLQSDVELIRHLLLIDQHGAAWAEHTGDDADQGRFRARRLAVLIRMLSTAARVLEEVPDPARRDEIVSNLRQRAGGRGPFKKMMARCGVSVGDVKSWITEMLLARRQLQIISDQVASAGVSTPDEKVSAEDAAWRELQSNRALKEGLNNWLGIFLNRGEVHFVDAPSP